MDTSTTTREETRSQESQTSHALDVGKLAISFPIAPNPKNCPQPEEQE
jgi:hypothetical protein